MKFEIFKSKANHQWYFRLVASNGRIIAQSEGYHNREDCIDTITSIRNHMYRFYISIKEVEG
jgi:uncharacterized protein YegP (UPF0339 family)